MSPLIDEANHVDFITGLDAVFADLHNPCSISQKQYRAGPLLNRSSDPRVAAAAERHAKLTRFNKARGPITWIVLFLAFGICAYTGFLISALIRYPLINTAVLPALFVASGVSAGTAAAKLLATAVFGEKRDSHTMHILHLAEWPMMAAEISCIFMIAMAMIFGMAGAQAAVTAFTTGVWATVFWVGAVGVGFGVPFALGMTGCTRSAAGFWTAGFAAVAGMMCLRLFILYAGQLNSLMLTPV